MKKRPLASRAKPKQPNHGFTLVEVLVAGVMLSATLVAVARFSAIALAGSSNQRDRQALEAAINNNIQLIQQADSQISTSRLENRFFHPETLASACQQPSQFLKTQIMPDGQLSVEQPRAPESTTDYNLRRSEDIKTIQIQGGVSIEVLKITYSFNAPEQSITSETRTFEVSPSFESSCYQ